MASSKKEKIIIRPSWPVASSGHTVNVKKEIFYVYCAAKCKYDPKYNFTCI